MARGLRVTSADGYSLSRSARLCDGGRGGILCEIDSPDARSCPEVEDLLQGCLYWCSEETSAQDELENMVQLWKMSICVSPKQCAHTMSRRSCSDSSFGY